MSSVETTPASFDRESITRDLQTKGYTVIPNVIPPEECDKYINTYKNWVQKFGDDKPHWSKSLIHQYRLSHCEAAWQVRLRSKPVFAAIWNTDKLFTSVDGTAIGEPPELGRTDFYEDGKNWFHIDQGSWRSGLHAYQGAVYLEETTEEDHCFRAIEGSFKYHDELMETFQNAKEESAGEDFYPLREEHKAWYREKGCIEKRIPVPKGGIVLWDSRTVHDNAGPIKGRKHSDRWRFVLFVCMVPAIWATEKDIELKKKAYNEMTTSAHWPSQGVWLFLTTSESEYTKDKKIEMIQEQPDVAKTTEVKQMAGMEKYDFEDGKSNGPGWEPKWNVDRLTGVKTSPYFE